MKKNYIIISFFCMTGLTGCAQPTQRKEVTEPEVEESQMIEETPTEKRITNNVRYLQNAMEKDESAIDVFNKIIKESAMVVVDFYADWCPPCKKFGPIFERVAAQEPNILFVKVNITTFADLANEYGIQSIPYIIFFKDGNSIYRQVAPSSAKQFSSLIQSKFHV